MVQSLFRFLSTATLVCLTAASAKAAVQVPTGLNSFDREQVVRILGWGTAGKLQSDPYPLGGYSGLEVGLSFESVPIDDLSRLGHKNVDPQENFTYPKISVGKGLYNNIDSWVHFIPFNETTGLSEYGGMVRWCFYQATFFPGTFSIVLHGNSATLSNTFSNQAAGADLITGMNISNLGLYLGGGKISSTGHFLGGNTGVTDTLKDETATVQGFHTVLGGSLRLQSLFAVLQIDIYTQPIFSTKIGVRF